MKLEYLRLKNFKTFQNIEMRDIPNFCILVGANGTGKTTLFNVFGFLKDAFTTNIHTALAKQGGSRGLSEVRSRGQNGDIEIELKFRATPKSPLATYELIIGETNGNPIVRKEVLKYRRGSRGKPWHYLDFSEGKGFAVTNELESVDNEAALERDEQTLKSPDILAIKGLAQFEKFPVVKALGELIENWHISDFHISRARPEQEIGYSEHLSSEGENLAIVIQYLYNRHRSIFDTILEKLSQRIPGITDVNAKTTDEGRVLLRFQDGSFQDPFLARYVSDGTIKMLAYLILLYDPNPHPLLCVEEPENQLYPKLLTELAEEFRLYAHRGGQVFVSTHAPDFLNAAELQEVFWLVKEAGYSTIKRARDDEQIAEYINLGDQMGYLWKEGFFEGIDPQ